MLTTAETDILIRTIDEIILPNREKIDSNRLTQLSTIRLKLQNWVEPEKVYGGWTRSEVREALTNGDYEPELNPSQRDTIEV